MPTILSVSDATNVSAGYLRPVREGEEVLNAGLVISVGIKQKEGSILHTQELVLRTSGITTQHPYLVELWIDLQKDYGQRDFKDKSAECQCKAGESADANTSLWLCSNWRCWSDYFVCLFKWCQQFCLMNVIFTSVFFLCAVERKKVTLKI